MYKKTNLESYICQGDIVVDYNSEEIPIYLPKEYYKGILILSFTCDLKWDKVRFVNFCPIFSLKAIFMDIKYVEKLKDKCKTAGKSLKNCIRNVFKQRLEKITKYESKDTFFLKEDSVFDNEACFADLEQISNITLQLRESDRKKKMDEMMSHRKASLENPWMEKLGFTLGNCFNRIATEDFPQLEFEKIVEELEPHIDILVKRLKI
ncbi:MAG: hypothetical protein ACXACO_19125 [Promethearchaeota archaeon]|jgi:hypothetical protein